MCWWCFNPACEDGEVCDHTQDSNPLLNSNTFRDAVGRIEHLIQGTILYAPGVPWNGNRPGFIRNVWAAVMGGPGGMGGMTCPICKSAINGINGQVDHVVPWQAYIRQSVRAAMQEHGQVWISGHIPDDFARVMYNDPNNLQPAHAHCNGSKSDSMPGHPAGYVRRANREAQRQETERQKETQRQLSLSQAREREERAARRYGL